MSDKTMWICGRIENNENWKQFTIHGVFDNEQKAIACCKNDFYFIGPVPLNVKLPEEVEEWTGAYYPLENLKK